MFHCVYSAIDVHSVCMPVTEGVIWNINLFFNAHQQQHKVHESCLFAQRYNVVKMRWERDWGCKIIQSYCKCIHIIACFLEPNPGHPWLNLPIYLLMIFIPFIPCLSSMMEKQGSVHGILQHSPRLDDCNRLNVGLSSKVIQKLQWVKNAIQVTAI